MDDSSWRGGGGGRVAFDTNWDHLTSPSIVQVLADHHSGGENSGECV